MIQAADFQRALQLTLLSPSTKKEWDIRTADLNRPGMQFCGFYEYFAFERPQVIGKVETQAAAMDASLALNQDRWYSDKPTITEDNLEFFVKYLKNMKTRMDREWKG